MPRAAPTYKPRQPFLVRPVRLSSRERGYTWKWQKARAAYLMENPICGRCGKGASVVDHITPHRGNDALFWDQSNWQSLCQKCHNIKTATEDGAFGR